ncbi:MAG: SgcJ/EcaC family oxidoreductase [Austwickia sp.]|nr:SgcJ/EcaC family oxidoreductase [Austwickia sp.]
MDQPTMFVEPAETVETLDTVEAVEAVVTVDIVDIVEVASDADLAQQPDSDLGQQPASAVAAYFGETQEEAEAAFVATRSGVVEAVREVLPTQVQAAETALAAPAAEASTYVWPSLVVSSLALSAEGYPVPTEAEVAALFDRWNAALQTGDPAEVVALYAPQATLLPTLSPTFCDDQPSKIEYFTAFLAKQPWGTVTNRTIYRGHGIAVDTGHYTFHLALTGDDVAARYTFTYVWDGGHWLISSHHSSAEPQPA